MATLPGDSGSAMADGTARLADRTGAPAQNEGGGSGPTQPKTAPKLIVDGVDLGALEDPSFDVRDFIKQYRRRLGITHLQKILADYQGQVKQELLELINERYGEFVKLSTRMTQLEDYTVPLVEPLRETRVACELFLDRLDEVCWAFGFCFRVIDFTYRG